MTKDILWVNLENTSLEAAIEIEDRNQLCSASPRTCRRRSAPSTKADSPCTRMSRGQGDLQPTLVSDPSGRRPADASSPRRSTPRPSRHRRADPRVHRRASDALHRTCAEGHLTGSAMVVDPSSGRVPLLLHAKVPARGCSRAATPDGERGPGGGRAARGRGGDGHRWASTVVTPAVDLDVHLFHAASGGEPDHLHLDVRYLVVRAARVARIDGQPRVARPARGWRSTTCATLRGRRWHHSPRCAPSLARLEEWRSSAEL